MAWVTVCPSAEVTAGELKRKRLKNGESIALTRLDDGTAVAFHNDCPHAHGPLGAGRLHGSAVVCPWHFFRFDLTTGAALGTPASIMKMKIYQVRENDGEIQVGL